jgi:hypothetical protein
MSDNTVFQAIKENYNHDIPATARQYVTLHERVMREPYSNSPHLIQEERKLALFALAIADVTADNYEAETARHLYADAIGCMKVMKKSGADVTSLEDIARQVGRKI